MNNLRNNGSTLNGSTLEDSHNKNDKWSSIVSDHSFVIVSDGTKDHLFGWGNNSVGQLGTGDGIDRETPVEISIGDEFGDNKTIKQVSASLDSSSAAIVNDGTNDHLYVWGRNNDGQLGTGDTKNVLIPTEISIGDDLGDGKIIKQISLSSNTPGKGYFSAVVVSDGENDHLYTWGANKYGQLGTGDKDSVLTPTEISISDSFDQTIIKQISLGDEHSAAIVNDGRNDHLFMWGNNADCELGLGKGAPSFELIPTETEIGAELDSKIITQISVGGDFSSAILNDGTSDHLYMWGDNTYDKLGTGLPDSKLWLPYEILTDEDNIKQISLGQNHAAAIVNDGTNDHLYAWGSNSSGQLGMGNHDNKDVPTEVSIGDDLEGNKIIKEVNANFDNTSAILNDGTNDHLYLWGDNDYGQLGIKKGETPGDVLEPMEFPINKSISIDDPTNIVETSDGETLTILINDGLGSDGEFKDGTLSIDKGSVEVSGGEELSLGENNLVVTGLNPGETATLTITLTTKAAEDVSKEINIDMGNLASISSPTNIVETSDGETFDVNITDGTEIGVVTELSLLIDNGIVEVASGELEIGTNNIIVSGLVPGDIATVTITLKSGYDDIVDDVEKISMDKPSEIGEVMNDVKTSDGETFDIDIADGVGEYKVNEYYLRIDNGNISVNDGGQLISGTNSIIVSDLKPKDNAIITIILKSNKEDVIKKININMGEISSIGDPSNINKTSDGETFDIEINDGTGQGVITKTNISIDIGVVEVVGGGPLVVGGNSVVVTGITPADLATLTISLESIYDPVVKDIEVELGSPAVIDEPTNIVKTSDGETFDINLTDGTGGWESKSSHYEIDNGNIVDESSSIGLIFGINHMVVTELKPSELGTVLFQIETKKMGTVSKDVKVQMGDEAIIDNPTNISQTSDGETFDINISDGTDLGIITKFNLSIDKGTVEVADEGTLAIGNNSIIVSKLEQSAKAVVTIKLESGYEPIVKDINISNLAIVSSLFDAKVNEDSITFDSAQIQVNVGSETNDITEVQEYDLVVTDSSTGTTWESDGLILTGLQTIEIDGLEKGITYNLEVQVKETEIKTDVKEFSIEDTSFRIQQNSFIIDDHSVEDTSFIFSVSIDKEESFEGTFDPNSLHLFSNDEELKIEFINSEENKYTYKVVELQPHTEYSNFNFSLHDDGTWKRNINNEQGNLVSVVTKQKFNMVYIYGGVSLSIILIIIIIIITMLVIKKKKNKSYLDKNLKSRDFLFR